MVLRVTAVSRIPVLGPLAVAVLWVGIGLAAWSAGFDLLGPLPLSRLAHAGGLASTLFGPSLVIAGLLFLGSCAHLRARYPVAAGFVALMVLGMVGQIVTGIVPIGPAGSSDPVHVAAGLVLGASIPLFLRRFAVAQPPGPWRQRCLALAWAQAAATVVGIGLSQASVAALAEIVPALAFHAWVLVVAVGPTDEPSAA